MYSSDLAGFFWQITTLSLWVPGCQEFVSKNIKVCVSCQRCHWNSGISHTAQQTVYLELCGFEFQDPITRELLEWARDNAIQVSGHWSTLQGLATSLIDLNNRSFWQTLTNTYCMKFIQSDKGYKTDLCKWQPTWVGVEEYLGSHRPSFPARIRWRVRAEGQVEPLTCPL